MEHNGIRKNGKRNLKTRENKIANLSILHSAAGMTSSFFVGEPGFDSCLEQESVWCVTYGLVIINK